MSIVQRNAALHPERNAATVSQAVAASDADALEAALADMAAAFSSDFVDGRVGECHNTYQHRARVIRQMTGRLAVMRASETAVRS